MSDQSWLKPERVSSPVVTQEDLVSAHSFMKPHFDHYIDLLRIMFPVPVGLLEEFLSCMSVSIATWNSGHQIPQIQMNLSVRAAFPVS